MTSASAMARRACSWTRASIGSSGSSSRPPVSTMTNRRPFHSVSPYRRSRVVRARSSTIAERWPRNRLNSVLLPTFGRPTIATTGIPPRPLATVRRRPRRRPGRDRGGPSGARSSGRPASRRDRARRGPARRHAAARLGRAGHLEDPLGDVAQVLDRRRGAARDADDPRRSRTAPGRSGRGRSRSGSPSVPAISHSRVSSLVLALDRPPTTTIRSTSPAASSVSCWRRIVTGQTVLTILSSWARETMKAASCSNFQGGWVDCEMSAIRLRARDGRLPLLLLVDDDRVGREAEQPDDLGVLGRAEQDDRVAVLDELDQLALLLDDPRAGAVDDLETALLGAFHDVRPDAVGADDDGRAVVDVVERFDGLDAEVLEVADDALVVDDLAEGMRRLAGGRRLLRLVDRLANAVAEAGALRDADFLDRSHGPIIARGSRDPRSWLDRDRA